MHGIDAMRNLKIVAVAAFAALAGAASPAVAQSSYCLPLQMELAALNEGRSSGSGGESALRRELDRARAQAQKQGCRRSFFGRLRGGAACSAILSRISRLEREVSGSRSGGFFGARRSPQEARRARVLDELRRSGCSQRSGTYRTVCVRVCDGYYFPLDFATSRNKLAADAQKCLAQYALGQAELFYHPNPGGDVSEAVSLSGERYTDQPYAFAYRASFHSQCAVQLHQGLASLAQRVVAFASTPGEMFEAAVAERITKTDVPIPIARADRSSDPDTVANRAGHLTPIPLEPPKQVEPVFVISDGRIGVRAVGGPNLFAEANPGPPTTVPGYKPPELRDFRLPQRASILPITR
jgi:Protein of unknown function (DUF2865)